MLHPDVSQLPGGENNFCIANSHISYLSRSLKISWEKQALLVLTSEVDAVTWQADPGGLLSSLDDESWCVQQLACT